MIQPTIRQTVPIEKSVKSIESGTSGGFSMIQDMVHEKSDNLERKLLMLKQLR